MHGSFRDPRCVESILPPVFSSLTSHSSLAGSRRTILGPSFGQGAVHAPRSQELISRLRIFFLALPPANTVPLRAQSSPWPSPTSEVSSQQVQEIGRPGSGVTSGWTRVRHDEETGSRKCGGGFREGVFVIKLLARASLDNRECLFLAFFSAFAVRPSFVLVRASRCPNIASEASNQRRRNRSWRSRILSNNTLIGRNRAHKRTYL